MICTANWEDIKELPPPPGKTVLLYQRGDLYPVVAHRGYGIVGEKGEKGNFYILEEGGDEAGEHRKYPFLHSDYVPTHWCELPATPFEEEILEGR